MEIASVLLIVASGTALASGFGRLVLGWRYEVVALATSVVIFGVGGLSLIVFTNMGLNGVLFTFMASALMPFVFVKFNADQAPDEGGPSVLGCLYWVCLLIIFTVSGFKAWSISGYVKEAFSLEDNVVLFYLILCLLVVVGGLSMFMFIRECRRVRGG